MEKHAPVRHGAIEGAEEIKTYQNSFLQALGTHQLGVKGVNTNGCNAIIVANDNPNKAEEGGE